LYFPIIAMVFADVIMDEIEDFQEGFRLHYSL
jgi:hypothetical protein